MGDCCVALAARRGRELALRGERGDVRFVEARRGRDSLASLRDC